MTQKDKEPLNFEVQGLDFEVEWFPSRDKDHPRAGWAEAAQELSANGDDGAVWPQFPNADDQQEREAQPAPERDREIEAPGMDEVRAAAARAARIEAIELKAAEIRAERGDIQPPPQEQDRGFER